MRKELLVLIVLCLLTASGYNTFNNYIQTEKTHRCFIKYKHYSPPAYRVQENRIFVLLDEKQREFEVSVAISTFRSCKEKSYVSFDLAEKDIERSGAKEAISMFFLLFCCITFCYFVYFVVTLVEHLKNVK